MARGSTQNTLMEFLDLVPEPLRTQVYHRRTEIRRTPGRTLIQEGIPCTEVFFLRAGEAEVRLYSSHWREMVYLHTLGPGDVFGEISALDGKARSANVEALSHLVADTLRASDFVACLNSSPAAGIWLAKRMASSLRRLTDKVFELSALNVSARIHCELLRLADRGLKSNGHIVVDPAPNHQELADRVGTNREAVTREIGYLSKQKIVEYKRRKLVFIDLAALERGIQR
jgi:CRP-like cAMP-binding protein